MIRYEIVKYDKYGKRVTIMFTEMDDDIRGRYHSRETAEDGGALYISDRGIAICTHNFPEYYPGNKSLFLPGDERKDDRTYCYIPIGEWPDVQAALEAVGAVCTEWPGTMPIPDIHIGQKPVPEIKKEKVCIHKGGGRKLEFVHAWDWSWIQFVGIAEALRGKGSIYSYGEADYKLCIKSAYEPQFQIEVSGKEYTLYVRGRDKGQDDERVKIPEEHRTKVRRALRAYERYSDIAFRGIQGWYVDGRELMVNPHMGDRLESFGDVRSTNPLASAIAAAHEGMVIGYDPAAGKDKTAVTLTAVQGDSGSMSNVNISKKDLVNELKAAKAAFEKAMNEQAADIDSKVQKVWAELQADPKKASGVVEYIDPVNMVPYLKQYDEVLKCLSLVTDEVVKDVDVNSLAACDIRTLINLDRMMATMANNYNKKRVTIQRS